MFLEKNIARLLNASSAESSKDGDEDVVYALFLEPHTVPEQSSIASKAIHYAINNFQPDPVMAHVELVIPCVPGADEPVNFATYIGENSKWQTNTNTNMKYYLTSGNKWRAVPVFGAKASTTARKMCSQSVGVKYSLMRYLTASWPLRYFSKLVPNKKRSPAHCATLTSRILKESIPNVLRHASAWYGPATLYGELLEKLRQRNILPESTLMSASTSESVDCILRKRDEDVMAMLDDKACLNAIRALTLKVASAETYGDSLSQKISQRQLATALLRWSVLRRPTVSKSFRI
tara:strand:- start:5210 stop:6082 length:873 start_codon:yes stop_codon:yes gene_type:complete